MLVAHVHWGNLRLLVSLIKVERHNTMYRLCGYLMLWILCSPGIKSVLSADVCSSVPEGQRKDCGWHGINQTVCETELNCCWLNSTQSGVPWCFYDKNLTDAVKTVEVCENYANPTLKCNSTERVKIINVFYGYHTQAQKCHQTCDMQHIGQCPPYCRNKNASNIAIALCGCNSTCTIPSKGSIWNTWGFCDKFNNLTKIDYVCVVKDRCAQIHCPQNSYCLSTGCRHATCTCKQGYYSSSDKKCILATGIIRVTGFTLKLLYQSAYSNPYSAEFTNIAGQINKKLLSIFRIHLGSSVVAIQVYNITNGSLVVDYNVLSNDTSSISVSQVQTVANDAVNDSTLTSLKPDTDYSRRPSAKESNACEVGAHNCKANEACVPKPGGFTCNCSSCSVSTALSSTQSPPQVTRLPTINKTIVPSVATSKSVSNSMLNSLVTPTVNLSSNAVVSPSKSASVLKNTKVEASSVYFLSTILFYQTPSGQMSIMSPSVPTSSIVRQMASTTTSLISQNVNKTTNVIIPVVNKTISTTEKPSVLVRTTELENRFSGTSKMSVTSSLTVSTFTTNYSKPISLANRSSVSSTAAPPARSTSTTSVISLATSSASTTNSIREPPSSTSSRSNTTILVTSSSSVATRLRSMVPSVIASESLKTKLFSRTSAVSHRSSVKPSSAAVLSLSSSSSIVKPGGGGGRGKKKGRLNTLDKVAIGLGAAILLVIIAALIYCWKQRKPYRHLDYLADDIPTTGGIGMYQNTPADMSSPAEVPMEQIIQGEERDIQNETLSYQRLKGAYENPGWDEEELGTFTK